MGVGMNLKEILRDKKMTIKQLAESSGISVNTLYSITRRDSERVDNIIIQRLAAALQVDPYSLYSWDQATEALEKQMNARERADAAMEQMTPEGQVKVADYAEDILPRYKAGEGPQEGGRATPAPQEGKDTTPPTGTPETPPEGK